METLEQATSHWRRSDVFIVNFEHILYLALVFLLLTLNMLLPAGSVVKKLLKNVIYFILGGDMQCLFTRIVLQVYICTLPQ